MLASPDAEFVAELLGVSKAEAELISTASTDARANWGLTANDWAASLAGNVGELLRRGSYSCR